MAGPQLSSAAAQGLVQWIDRGGTLVATAGAGTLDEYSSPMSILSSAQGIEQRSLQINETFLRPRVEVPRLQSLGRIASTLEPDFSFDAVAWHESLTPGADAEVLARFEDGTAAITLHALGRGRAVTIGTLPGAAYLRSGVTPPAPLPDRGPFMHQALTAYDAVLRGLITRWATDAAARRPDVSDPLVEIGLAETPQQIVVPLANFGGRATTVDVAVPDARPGFGCVDRGSRHTAVHDPGRDPSCQYPPRRDRYTDHQSRGILIRPRSEICLVQCPEPKSSARSGERNRCSPR